MLSAENKGKHYPWVAFLFVLTWPLPRSFCQGNINPALCPIFLVHWLPEKATCSKFLHLSTEGSAEKHEAVWCRQGCWLALVFLLLDMVLVWTGFRLTLQYTKTFQLLSIAITGMSYHIPSVRTLVILWIRGMILSSWTKCPWSENGSPCLVSTAVSLALVLQQILHQYWQRGGGWSLLRERRCQTFEQGRAFSL